MKGEGGHDKKGGRAATTTHMCKADMLAGTPRSTADSHQLSSADFPVNLTGKREAARAGEVSC